MFFKQMSNGKYRYYEKFYDNSEDKWKQVSITLTSKTRQAQGEARRQLEIKIKNKLLEYDKLYIQKNEFENLAVREVYTEYKAFRKQELKDSTFATQSALLDKLLSDILDKRLRAISSVYFQKYFMTSANSISYKKLQKTLVNLFFKYAIKVGYIEYNPIDKVELPKQRKSLEDLEKKRAKFFSKEEMTLFKKSFGTTSREIRMNYLIEFMYLTGLRIGEALALMWDNVDFSNRLVTVKYNIDSHSTSLKKFKLSTPKTLDSFRVISVNDRCIDILSKMSTLNSQMKFNNSKFIFLGMSGNLIQPLTLNIYLKKTGKKANIKGKNYKDFSSHMLRHSHVSLLTELGVPIKVIMERVGHRDEKTTLHIYTHVTGQMKNDVVEKMNDLMI